MLERRKWNKNSELIIETDFENEFKKNYFYVYYEFIILKINFTKNKQI